MRPLLLPCLTGLAANLLALVPHALALVRVGLAELADVGGNLANLLLVDALDDEARGRLDPEGDALRSRDEHWVRVAERELEVAALGRHAVTGANDLKRLGVALGHAGDHVRDQRAGQ